jgi:HNH endonuclease
MPRKPSPLSDRAAFEAAATAATSIREFLETLGLRAAGGNFANAHKWAEVHGIAIPRSSGVDTIRIAIARNMRPDEEVFCENSDFASRMQIKKRLKAKGLPQVCDECKLSGEWNGKPLVLQLDHINGVYNDNRIENLRLLCPNCHSQTDTFCAKNLK